MANTDTGLSDAADTSVADEADAEAALLDEDISFDDVTEDDGEATDESEATDNDEAATESEDETDESSDEDVESDDSGEAEDTGTAPVDEAAERKRQNDEYARQRIAERQAREQQRLAIEAAKNQAQQEYLNGAEDTRDLALRQLQIDAYNNRVQTNNDRLTSGIDKAVAAIDLFHTGTTEVKEELANSLDDFERMYVQRDENGDPVAVQGDVFQYLQAKAESIRRLTEIGARQQEQAKTRQKSRTLKTPANAPKTPKVDPELAAFDEEAASW